ncbi:hypothetical protein BU14_0116s0012 [Porphyra umbilicalis]|uniref:Uncharacterized protein n=1 Tax=Porphyra umbilicalis TaxID=2786 RepID=A0A1X6PC07_PORUM|nr:hypothetical protein BU14_0116s0012 [Porphyra umbilicalis]|eukprot:OSX78193.1 hypothetical protein BU14_0116s0012 [Porphyra umbilicalis]
MSRRRRRWRRSLPAAAVAGATPPPPRPTDGRRVAADQWRRAGGAAAAGGGRRGGGGGPVARPRPRPVGRCARGAAGGPPRRRGAGRRRRRRRGDRHLVGDGHQGGAAAPSGGGDGGPRDRRPPRETIQERIERLRTAGERAAAEKAAAQPTLASTVKRFEGDGPADDVAALTAQIAAARMSDVERDTLYGRLARGDATAAADVRAALLRRQVVGSAAGSGLGAKAAGGGVWELLGRAKARHAGAEEAGKRRLGWDGVTRKAVAVLERELLAALATDTAAAALAASAERDAAGGAVVDADVRLRRVAELRAADADALTKMRSTVRLLGAAEASRAALEGRLKALGL